MDGHGRILGVREFSYPWSAQSEDLQNFILRYHYDQGDEPATIEIIKGPDVPGLGQALLRALADGRFNLKLPKLEVQIQTPVYRKVLHLGGKGSTAVEFTVRGEELQIVVPGDTKPMIFRGSEKPEVTIGRVQGDVFIANPFISGQHLVLQYRNGQWHFSDLSSTNGTFDEQGNRVTEGVLGPEAVGAEALPGQGKPNPVSVEAFRKALADKDFDKAEDLLAQIQAVGNLNSYDRINLPNELKIEQDRARLMELIEIATRAYSRMEKMLDYATETVTSEAIEQVLVKMESEIQDIRDAFSLVADLDIAVKVQEHESIENMGKLEGEANRLMSQAHDMLRELHEVKLRAVAQPAAPLGTQQADVKLSPITLTEFKQATSGLPVHFDGDIEDRDILKEFPPAHKIEFNGVTYYLSKPFASEAGERPAFIVYIHRKNPEDGQQEIFVRALYKSNSQKVMWRFASHKMGHWIGKGLGEETTDAPVELIPSIHALIQQYQSSPEGLPEQTGFYEVLEPGGRIAPTAFQRSVVWKTHLMGKVEREQIQIGRFEDSSDPTSFVFEPALIRITKVESPRPLIPSMRSAGRCEITASSQRTGRFNTYSQSN